MSAPATQTPTHRAVARAAWRVDVTRAFARDVPGASDARLEVALHAVAPAEGARLPIALVCLPGGFLSRQYFDLEVDGHFAYSFAEHMARAGFTVLCIDHLGIGESSRPRNPADGYALGAETSARLNQVALEDGLARLRAGVGRIPPIGIEATVGVGHSMGSCLSVVQQALASPHRALALFSFTTDGAAAFLDDHEREVAKDEARAHDVAPELAARRFGSPFPPPVIDPETGKAAFSAGTAPEDGHRALQSAQTDLLAVPGMLSMMPNAFTPYANAIDVPVFVAVGDHDLHRVQRVPTMLPNAHEVTTYTQDDCWHCHNVANTRHRLWDRTAHWIRGVVPIR